jgi:cellulose synthase/poly-beta-1,6-N-acetylglucosamine synthase-like glycosyltransferase
MVVSELIFWSLVACVIYTYAIYPIIMGLLARFRANPVRRAPFVSPITIIVAAYNEETHLERRLGELVDLCKRSRLQYEILVASDGSEDRTNTIARSFASDNVGLIFFDTNIGKSAALSHAVSMARHEIVLFADARQRWDENTIDNLLANFSDPTVGAVSGDLVIESSPGVLAGVGLYWRFEKWLRRRESEVHSMVSVSGSIAAVRKKLFIPIPPGTILDDVYWPLAVAMYGYRVVHDETARAYDRLPARTRDEFRRKVRTLSGNFQLLARVPQALNPISNPVFFQLLSHKILRLVVPWALIAVLVLSCVLEHPVYRLCFIAQLGFYAVAIAGLSRFAATRLKLASAAASFLVLNTAAAFALCTFVAGRSTRSWTKVSYSPVL